MGRNSDPLALVPLGGLEVILEEKRWYRLYVGGGVGGGGGGGGGGGEGGGGPYDILPRRPRHYAPIPNSYIDV